MDENLKTEVSQRAIKYLDALEKSVTQGGEFLTEQAAGISREIVNWEIARHSAVLLVVVGLIATVWIGRHLIVKSLGPVPTEPPPGTSYGDLHSEQQFRDGVFVGTFIGSVVITVLLTIPLCLNLMDLSKPIFAPRLVVLDHVKSLATR